MPQCSSPILLPARAESGEECPVGTFRHQSTWPLEASNLQSYSRVATLQQTEYENALIVRISLKLGVSKQGGFADMVSQI